MGGGLERIDGPQEDVVVGGCTAVVDRLAQETPAQPEPSQVRLQEEPPELRAAGSGGADSRTAGEAAVAPDDPEPRRWLGRGEDGVGDALGHVGLEARVE